MLKGFGAAWQLRWERASSCSPWLQPYAALHLGLAVCDNAQCFPHLEVHARSQRPKLLRYLHRQLPAEATHIACIAVCVRVGVCAAMQQRTWNMLCCIRLKPLRAGSGLELTVWA